jgi:hypothetical protein
MHSFEYYKDHVPIVQVAEALGYEFNKKAGRNPLEYKHPDHNTIVISNPKGRQRYFTRHETENKGSVIDFVKHRLPLFNEYYNREAEGINKVLASFAGVARLSGGQAFSSPSKKLWLSEKKAFNLKDFRLRHPEPKDLLYLSNHRGINKETLAVFIPHIQLVKARHKPTTNIGFPYQVPGKNEIVGFELVNYLFKGHARGSNKSEGLWIADLRGTGFPPNVFIAESAIDAMSFYQLYKQKYQLDQAAFISTGGYVTDKQLRNVLQHYSSSLIHTLFDNDISGHLYDIRTACMKANKNLKIHKDQNEFNFQLTNSSFSLPKVNVSLTNFRKESGLRSNIRVHKAKGKDFNEMLVERAKQQLNRTMKIR